jgi:hypothetical protein
MNESVNVRLSPKLSYDLINIHDTCNDDNLPTTCRLQCKRDQFITDCKCRPTSVAPELLNPLDDAAAGSVPVPPCTMAQMINCTVNIDALQNCYSECLPACVNTVVDMTLMDRQVRPLSLRERVAVDGRFSM